MAETVASATALPPDEAIAFLRQKVNLPSERWTDVWQEAHTRSFTVAGATTQALVADFRQAVARAIEQGTTLADFRRDFDSIVSKHGWEYNGTAGWRSQIIYETNLSMAYSAGRYAQMTEPDTLAVYPYWQYMHTSSARPRPQHLLWVGTTLPANDPWWGTHYPPNGWRCRCSVRPLSAAGLRRQGKTGPDEAPPINAQRWTSKDGRRTEMVPDGIDPGFAYNPGAAWGRPPATPGVPPLPPVPSTPRTRPTRLPPAEAVPAPLPPEVLDITRSNALAADARLREASLPWAESLNANERKALDAYRTGLGRRMNRAYEGLIDDPLARADAIRLAAAVSRSPAPADLRLFRGVHGSDAAEMAALPAGGTYVRDRLLSTTLVREGTSAYAVALDGTPGQVVEIRVRAGTMGVAYVHPFPEYRFGQYEVLLKPGMVLRVVDATPGGLVLEAVDGNGPDDVPDDLPGG